MSYRFTDTDKWNDKWFLDLKPLEKLLFNYLCDNCDIAGFIEINVKKWASEIDTNGSMIEGACKGLARGLKYSKDNNCIYIRNFLKHQKNLPLNENNKAHQGIIKRFMKYTDKFDIQNINDFIEGACKGLGSPTGNGNGIGNIEDKINISTEKTWKNDFETYKSELRLFYNQLSINPEYITERQRYHPGLDICKTIEKACKDFWATEAGWKNKKSKRTEVIDWKRTFNNALTQKVNQVWRQKNEY